LPPLNGLRAFEASGRHLSFKQAAEELGVTPGAVSQQVKHLEQAMGVPLFERLHRSLVLTNDGEALLPGVIDAFRRLSAASDGVARSLKTRVLRLGISPRLAAEPGLVIAKIANKKRPPDFVSVRETDAVSDLLDGGLDALLRPGVGPYPGLHAERLKLSEAFRPHREASFIVWPGLSECREVLKLKALLGRSAAAGKA
jgi:LysR family glycine cleavage system transcriptional activator